MRETDDPCWVALLRIWARSEYPLATVNNDAMVKGTSLDLVQITKTYDARLNAFHRRAVPVFLPYDPNLDKQTWWSSQAILFHLTTGCLSGSGFALFAGFQTSNTDHRHYTRGRNLTSEDSLVSGLRKKHGVPVWAVPGVRDVANLRGPREQSYLTTVPVSIGELSPDVWNADRWTTTASWQGCMALEKRFEEFVHDPRGWM